MATSELILGAVIQDKVGCCTPSELQTPGQPLMGLSLLAIHLAAQPPTLNQVGTLGINSNAAIQECSPLRVQQTSQCQLLVPGPVSVSDSANEKINGLKMAVPGKLLDTISNPGFTEHKLCPPGTCHST
ncbi:hypothetical protein PSHT_05648 [Puccinia striiformis]|uniref:Uncharacterized protein n=3 Tax=Puccinia striiformis TaxID=27350 RepID=A0A0L0UT31_9BASI|nr:hypothetical protein PSTG_16481 [Puccinia striiformis f. sp. tritici PST-78]POV98452.1 hypothetical protein PSTT_14420 [Puccinia striiformis]POW18568.1 hypothetical protein PSHT_05648 [Puccinia striiformis]